MLVRSKALDLIERVFGHGLREAAAGSWSSRRNACGAVVFGQLTHHNEGPMRAGRRVKVTQSPGGCRRRRESPSSRLYPARLASIKVLSGAVWRLSTAFGAPMAISLEGRSRRNRAGMPAKCLFHRGMPRARESETESCESIRVSAAGPCATLQKSGDIRSGCLFRGPASRLLAVAREGPPADSRNGRSLRANRSPRTPR